MAGEWIERNGSLWKDRARAFQLRLRDRFRVAVDRRRHWKVESDRSLVIQQFVLRIWGDSSTAERSCMRFYRKRVGKDFDLIDDSGIVRFLQALAVPLIGNACHAFMRGLNDIQIYGAEKLHRALLERPQGKSLVTVSNHVASVDDPLVIASLLPPSAMLDARNMRWTLCATDRCFKNVMLSTFFRCVKVLPVSRGDGIYQKGMDMALSKLNNGGWVHIFPEGSRSRDGGRSIGTSKRGIGRLVMDADIIPIVIPFVHTGMQEIMPIGSSFPKVGKQVTVVVGNPIPLNDLIVNDAENVSRGILYDAVSSRITNRLRELKVQADRLALENANNFLDFYLHNSERVYRLWQQVDWEAFGIEDVMQSQENPPITKQLMANHDHQQEPNSNRRTFKMNFSYDGGIVSRVRGCMNPAEFMGFAASGLFMNEKAHKESDNSTYRYPDPAKIWKQFDEIRPFNAWNRL
ncbi:N-acylphosphatidylethanolamine synthase [Apostasia shenzhenica]|uniref:Tafazzin family protein n=1 Tax=Apostasia shenzhenica TaxID=1088818 RepID=A0A2I0AS96_9ASPA|nr:N-acylphosphatidylethanolamine synthase [Apostasia shenzhenica]